MLIEIKHWQSEELEVGDLLYHKGTLLKVTRISRRRDKGDVHTRTVKFRKIGRVKLRPYVERVAAQTPRERE